MLKALAKTDLLILDDWGAEKLKDEQRLTSNSDPC